MRCTNDIKARIQSNVRAIVNEIKQDYSRREEEEKSKISYWRAEKFKSLQFELQPIIKEWAKKLKKNYSSYTWESCLSSEDLFNKVVQKMFNEKGWNDQFPKVTTKKLIELQKKQDEFKAFVENTLNETYVKVSFVKSLEELDDLIEQAKISIVKFYADQRNF